MQPTTPPGWYPDPSDPGKRIYWDGTAWSGLPSPTEAGKSNIGKTTAVVIADAPKPKLNAFFVVLAVLSGMPTAFFLLAFVTSEGNGILGFATAWCGMWTYVWYSLRHR